MPSPSRPQLRSSAPGTQGTHPGDDRADRARQPWLGIIGIGEDGVEGLGTNARAWIEKSELVFGSERQLSLARPLIQGRAIAWPSPFPRELTQVFAARGSRVTVLASGDPFHYGIGPLLAARSTPGERYVVPGVSSFSLAAARLGWSLQDVYPVSAHGRSLDAVSQTLAPGARLLVLTSDASGPAEIARHLVDAGFGRSELHVLERLGGPSERVRRTSAEGFDLDDVDPLQVVAIRCERSGKSGEPSSEVARPGRVPGLPDQSFEHDGQLTKRELRSLALAQLAPTPGDGLWDVGAGSGSIAIEWLRVDDRLKAWAIEARVDRSDRIRRNANRLGVSRLEVVHGTAPAALAPLPRPHAVFVGGGASEPIFELALRALHSRGRLVAHAVTLETEGLLREQHKRHGGRLVQIAISHAEPLGGYTAWRPARPIVQWSFVKP